MNKIIFIFWMVLTIYKNSQVFADNIEKADDFVKIIDRYRYAMSSLAHRINLREKGSTELKLKRLYGRLTSNQIALVEKLSSIEADCQLRMSTFFNYIEKISLTEQMESTIENMKNVIFFYTIDFNLMKLRKNLDEKKIKIKSVKKGINVNYLKERTKDMEDIHKVITEQKLLDDIMKSTKNINEKALCDIEGSPQEIIYNFYITCLSLEVLVMALRTNALAVYDIIEPDKKLQKTFGDEVLPSKYRMINYTTIFLSKLENFPKNYRNCDPFDKDKHERDETYTEMSGLYQRILLFSYSMLTETGCLRCELANFTNGTNAKECYSKIGESSTSWYENNIPKNLAKCTTPRKCAGTVSRCRTLKKPQSCTLINNPRRYQWLRDLDADIDENQLGQREFCDGLTQVFEEHSSGYNSRCSYCFCTCGDEAPYSSAVNTVSLLPSLANSIKNRVVIGARIIVQNNILHLQVREAKIDKNYKIDKDGPDRWIKIDDIHEKVLVSRLTNSTHKLQEFKDYIAWKENSTGFNFDEITLDYGRVVTGLKFGLSEVEEEENPNRIQIEVQSMEYNYETGQLIKDTEKWDRPNNKHPTFLKTGTRPSFLTNKKTIIDSNTDEWGHLEVSHDRSDAGQTTVPLFDAQTIESINKSPFGGIGFHHRSSNKKYSGFFALTCHSIDYYQFLKTLNSNSN